MSRRRRPGFCSAGRGDYVLLYTYGRSEFMDNSTTASIFTAATKTIKVTFSIADLPSLSYIHVSCPEVQDSPFTRKPEILWSSESLVLFRVGLFGSSEFFIYRAGQPGCDPSLDLLDGVASYLAKENLDPYLVGLIWDGVGGDYVLAAFKWESEQYKLHVFRSKNCAWTKELLVTNLPSWLDTNHSGVFPDKVIALGDGVLGYVDLWKGILICNLLEKPVTARFVPLPNLLPNNQKHYDEASARSIRDVDCTGSRISCIEMEDFYFTASIPAPDLLLDSEIDPTQKTPCKIASWRLVTWYREISSDVWRRGYVLDVDELGSVYLPPHSAGTAGTEHLPPNHLKPSSGAGKLPLRHLQTACPILCGHDVVCLLSKEDYWDNYAWIVTVDMSNKAVVGKLVPFFDKRTMFFKPAYITSALKKYLKSESDGGGSRMQDTRSHYKRCQSLLENTSNSSRYKRTLRSSTMEQRKRYG